MCIRDSTELVRETIELLDNGKIKVAEKKGNEWQVNQWIKKAILLSFRVNKMKASKGPYSTWYDKVEGKTQGWDEEKIKKTEDEIKKGIFTMDSYLSQLRQMKKMGGMEGVMSLLPGASKMKAQMDQASIDEKMLGHVRKQDKIYLARVRGREMFTRKTLKAAKTDVEYMFDKLGVGKGTGDTVWT